MSKSIWRTHLLVSLLLLGGAVCEVAGGTVKLQTSASISRDTAVVRLGDVAALEGENAIGMASLVVLDAVGIAARQSSWVEVNIDAIRRAIEESGASMGRLAISGSRCLVRIEGASPSDVPESTSASLPERSASVIEAEALPTIRGRVAGALADLYGVSRTDIRFLFDERDEEFLAQTEWGRRIAVQPATGSSTSRVFVDVRIYAGSRMVESRRVRVDVEIRRRVVTLLKSVSRKAELTEDILTESEMWLAPGGAAPVDGLGSAVGFRARSRLSAGSVLRESEIESAIVVRRNELVTVHCLRAGFEVRTRARARRDGGVGEVIEFTLEGSRRPFLARIDGPGRALLDLDGVGAMASIDMKERE